MSLPESKKKRKIYIWLCAIALVLALIIGACAIYLSDYYIADTDAISAFAPMDRVSIRELDDGILAFEPECATKGLIFYPGGKVAYTAYQPLMAACAERGILALLVEMPFNLAVFDLNAADGIQELFPEIDSWYIGGHSLGGSMAASYLSGHTQDFDGLVLLGSYSTANLSETSLNVLSVYGSEDRILNREKYEKNKENLPGDFTEIIIEGGNHAGFGMYGTQNGDGTPTITGEQQIYITAEHILELFNK